MREQPTIRGRSITTPDRRTPPGWTDLGLTPDALAWHAEAACSGTDTPDVFHPEPGGQSVVIARQAKALCADCPVRAKCLDWALTHNEQHGIWGGLSPTQRRPLRRAHQQQHEAALLEHLANSHANPDTEEAA